MLRLHFTAADVARVRMAPCASASWEMIASIQASRRATAAHVFDDWRPAAGSSAARTRAADLYRLIPATRGVVPDYLTPFTHASTMTALAPLLNDTAADLVQEQLTSLQLAPGARTAAWWRQRRDRITRAAIAHWSDSLAPYWTQIRACVATDLEHRSQTLAAAGVEGLLTTLGSGISWTYPTLSIPWFTDVDLPLCGRGLVLQPIYFGWRHALVQDDPGESTVLAIPVHEHVPLKSTPRAQPDELHAVLGRARSRILGLLASTPASTSDVARHTSMSPGNASRHLKALRYSGLVSSRRTGQQVTHQLTAAGAVLYRTQTQESPA